jgi:arylsulfatase A-like enzyme
VSERQNVLLLVLDTARARELALGWDAPTAAPAMRDMSEDGIVFKRAVAPSIWTVPSHGSLFTGLLPSEHGIVGSRRAVDGGWAKDVARHEDRWLPSMLSAAGYETFGISTNPYISETMGFTPGFARWRQIRDREGPRRPKSKMVRRVHRAARTGRRIARVFSPADRGGDRAVQALEDELSRQRRGPFFGFVNLMETHSPYWTPGARGLPLALRIRGFSLFAPVLSRRRDRVNKAEWQPPAAWLAVLRAFYASAVRYLDGVVERIGETLERRSLAEDTLLCVVSDHGEHLGERGLIGHMLSLHEELLHVPAFVRGPVDRAHVEAPTSTLELRRLILQRAMGRDEPAREPVGEFESMRLLRPSFRPRIPRPLVDSPGAAFYEGDWKLWAESDGAERFFRLGDLFEEESEETPTDVRKRLLARRDAWLGRVRAPSTKRRSPLHAPGEGISSEEVDEIEEHLMELGYIE